jgi:hypothetical protein
MSCASCSRGAFISRSAPLMVIDSLSRNGKIQSTSPLTRPRIGGVSAGGVQRKCAFRIDTNWVGALIPGRIVAACRAGTASTTLSPEASAILSSPKVSEAIRSPDFSTLCSSWSKRTVAPRSRSSLTAGSTNTLLRPSRAISGRQARPPASSVWRMIAPASPAEPSGGSIFKAASSRGCTRR